MKPDCLASQRGGAQSPGHQAWQRVHVHLRPGGGDLPRGKTRKPLACALLQRLVAFSLTGRVLPRLLPVRLRSRMKAQSVAGWNRLEPTRLSVLVDKHEHSPNGAHFLVLSSPEDRWVNLPANRDRAAGVLSSAHARLGR